MRSFAGTRLTTTCPFGCCPDIWKGRSRMVSIVTGLVSSSATNLSIWSLRARWERTIHTDLRRKAEYVPHGLRRFTGDLESNHRSQLERRHRRRKNGHHAPLCSSAARAIRPNSHATCSAKATGKGEKLLTGDQGQNRKIADIALEAGFTDLSFQPRFRRHFGDTPSGMRANDRKRRF